MFFPALHLPLRPLAWDAGEAETAVSEIVADALTAFDGERFWPAHRLEDGVPDGNTSFYIGATGMIWALSYLKRVGASPVRARRKRRWAVVDPGPLWQSAPPSRRCPRLCRQHDPASPRLGLAG